MQKSHPMRNPSLLMNMQAGNTCLFRPQYMHGHPVR